MNLPENLWNTYEFLVQIQSGQISFPGQSNNYSLLMNSLSDALNKDGFGVHSLSQTRVLAESTPSSPVTIIENLIPVIVCVVCAGFASGLTQVSKSLIK
jgi:hypothetical protein